MCWSRKGVPGSERSGEVGTPFLGPAAEPNFGSERAAGWPFGCPVHIRTANRTPETNTKGVRYVARPPRAGSRAIAPAPAVQHQSWANAPRGARAGVQSRPRWPACEATAYRRGPAPAAGATELVVVPSRDSILAQTSTLVLVDPPKGGPCRIRASPLDGRAFSRPSGWSIDSACAGMPRSLLAVSCVCHRAWRL